MHRVWNLSGLSMSLYGCCGLVRLKTWILRLAVPTTSSGHATSAAYTLSGTGCVCAGEACLRSQYLIVRSQDAVTSMFESSLTKNACLTGASCVATTRVWLVARDHILTVLSQEPGFLVRTGTFFVGEEGVVRKREKEEEVEEKRLTRGSTTKRNGTAPKEPSLSIDVPSINRSVCTSTPPRAPQTERRRERPERAKEAGLTIFQLSKSSSTSRPSTSNR